MPKRKPDQLPRILQSKKGDYFCNFDRRKIYLGRNYETARARLLEMILSRSTELKTTSPRKVRLKSPPSAQPARPALTIIELVAGFMETMKKNSHFDKLKTMARAVVRLYGETDADDFGPQALIACRNEWVAQNLSRNYINKLTGWVLRCFQWGVTQETVRLETYQKLKLVEPLKQGEAIDHPPREDVPDIEIIKTLPHLLPTVRDMVILQRISGMRPSEIFRMTLEQFVKREPDAWIYVPFRHKTKIHNKTRIIGFGRFEISILEAHANGKKPDEPLFSPQASWCERAERLGQPKPKKHARIGAMFTKDSYARHISRAIEQANEQAERDGTPEALIQRWTPYQLRHAAATFISLLMDQAAAATALGHASTQTTRIYDHSAVEKTLRFIKERDDACGAEIQGLMENFREIF
ncbi:MAG: tyrosine-type recombinase/integrase [Thermoguttaceae bacterium]|nr:tyrosine-type recombinase/integrase [Thermoguttaceae bacterium]